MAALTQNNMRDQNVASIEAARVADVTRQAAETTQETIRTAVDTASRAFQGSATQFARVFGITAEQEQDLAGQSKRNLEAITECSAVLMRGFQEITREWLNLAQRRAQHNIERVQALAACRNVQDVVAAQTELVRDNFREMVENSRRVAETSVRVADEAARTLTAAHKKRGSRRLDHAA
jgi:phasin family protein